MIKRNYVKSIDEEIAEAQERVNELEKKKSNFNELSPLRKFATILFSRYEVNCKNEWDQEERNSNTWSLTVHRFWIEEAETLMEFIGNERP